MRALVQPRRRSIGPLEAIEFPASNGSPAIVCLHGYGADAADLARLAADTDLPRAARWLFPDAPIAFDLGPFAQGRAWFPIDEDAAARRREEDAPWDLSAMRPPGMDEALDALLKFIEAGDLPWENLIVGGFSQGAMLALELALRSPASPLGLFILSGTLVDEETVKKLAPARRGLKFFQSHGTGDPLLSHENAERLNALLNREGLEGGLFSFPGGHSLPPEASLALEKYLQAIL